MNERDTNTVINDIDAVTGALTPARRASVRMSVDRLIRLAADLKAGRESILTQPDPKELP